MNLTAIGFHFKIFCRAVTLYKLSLIQIIFSNADNLYVSVYNSEAGKLFVHKI